MTSEVQMPVVVLTQYSYLEQQRNPIGWGEWGKQRAALIDHARRTRGLVTESDALAYADADAKVREALEALKFHPSASHVDPTYRDWFNATIDRVLTQEGAQ